LGIEEHDIISPNESLAPLKINGLTG